MTPLNRLLILALSSLAMPAFTQIQSGDFLIPEAGSEAYIDGARGAPLHIEYIGPRLTSKLSVKVKSNDSSLRLTPSTCTFSSSIHVCRSEIHLANVKNKVYGVKTFTVTEVGGTLTASGPEVTTSPVTFGVGITESGASQPVHWNTEKSLSLEGVDTSVGDHPKGSSPVILVNATQSDRLYGGVVDAYDGDHATFVKGGVPLKKLRLPSGNSCYLDTLSVDLATGLAWATPFVYSESDSSRFRIEDITSGDPIFNGFSQTASNDISTCKSSSYGSVSCASGKWGSMTVGLANIGGRNLFGGTDFATWRGWRDDFDAGQVKVIENKGFDRSDYIFWTKNWTGESVALLLIQGSTDGSGFDARAVAPNILQIKSAPPCSNYIQP
jgi:hypothetical protein